MQENSGDQFSVKDKELPACQPARPSTHLPYLLATRQFVLEAEVRICDNSQFATVG